MFAAVHTVLWTFYLSICVNRHVSASIEQQPRSLVRSLNFSFST